MREVEILETEEDIEISNEPLLEKPKDIRAQHCTTTRELDLWKFSSNYQTYKGGHCDLQTETGLDSEGSTGSVNLAMYN